MHCFVFCSKVSPLETINRAQVSCNPNHTENHEVGSIFSMEAPLFHTFLSIFEANWIQKLSWTVAIPNVDIFVLQFLRIGWAFDEPQQLLHQTTPEDPLGCQQRKPSCKGEWRQQSIKSSHYTPHFTYHFLDWISSEPQRQTGYLCLFYHPWRFHSGWFDESGWDTVSPRAKRCRIPKKSRFLILQAFTRL